MEYQMKPIEKTEIKEPKQAEFLVKTDSGYVLQVLDENAGGADVVRVPDGADTFAGDDNCHYFWQHRSGKKHLLIGCGSSLERYTQWVECEDSADEWLSNFDGDNSLRILWQREISAEEFKSKLPESTFKDFKQPEDLPFVDDKCYTNKSNGVFKLPNDEPRVDTYKSEFGIEPPISLNDQYAEIEKVRQSAWNKQEGGSHYKNLKIQPMQYALENKLDYAQANVIKYVTRHADKNGKEDLLKAIHNIELMIEFYYGDEK